MSRTYSEIFTMYYLAHLIDIVENDYRNTIAGSPRSKWFFFCFFWKNKVRLSKTEFLNFIFFSKKSLKITLNSLEVIKWCKN